MRKELKMCSFYNYVYAAKLEQLPQEAMGLSYLKKGPNSIPFTFI